MEGICQNLFQALKDDPMITKWQNDSMEYVYWWSVLNWKKSHFHFLEIHLHSLFFFRSFLILCFRDHPDTIKRRFISVSVICVIIPILLQCFGTTSNAESVSLQNDEKSNATSKNFSVVCIIITELSWYNMYNYRTYIMTHHYTAHTLYMYQYSIPVIL